MKPSQNGKITLLFTDIRRSIMLQLGIFNVSNMSFNAICENKNIMKIFEFTVLQNYQNTVFTSYMATPIKAQFYLVKSKNSTFCKSVLPYC